MEANWLVGLASEHRLGLSPAQVEGDKIDRREHGKDSGKHFRMRVQILEETDVIHPCCVCRGQGEPAYFDVAITPATAALAHSLATVR